MSPVESLQPHQSELLFLRATRTPGSHFGRLLTALPLMATLALVVSNAIRTPIEQMTCTPLESMSAEIRVLINLGAPQALCLNHHGRPQLNVYSDALAIVLLLCLSGGFFTARYQWQGYSALVPHMVNNGSLVFTSPRQQARFSTEIRNANRFMRKLGRFSVVFAIASAVLVSIFAMSQYEFGIYASLAPDDATRAAWARDAYAGWWLSLPNNKAAAVVYYAVGAFALYVVTTQNIIGIRILGALWRARSTFQMRADHLNADGYYGWLPVRMILSATYLQIALHGVALACIAAQLPPDWLHSPLFWFAALQWVLTLPFYLAWPLLITVRKIRHYKTTEVTFLSAQAHHLAESLDQPSAFALEADYARRIETVRNVPSLPYGNPRDTVLYLLAATADVAAFAAILSIKF